MAGWSTCDFIYFPLVVQSDREDVEVLIKTVCKEVLFMVKRLQPQSEIKPKTNISSD